MFLTAAAGAHDGRAAAIAPLARRGTDMNSLITEPLVALNKRTIPSEPPAATTLPSGLNATE